MLVAADQLSPAQRRGRPALGSDDPRLSYVCHGIDRVALQRSMTRIEMVRSGRFALLRITEPDRIKLEKHLFRRYPELEWGSFLRFGFRRTSWGLASCFVDAIWPEPGELDRQSPITTFNSEYTLRAFRAAQ